MSSAWAGKLNKVTAPLSPSSPSIYSDQSQVGWADMILLPLVLEIFKKMHYTFFIWWG